jgi:GntP family gluconate:H+ symporter
VAYLVPVIGAGSLMGSWMNDSGFWVFAKMGVLTEGETLRSWTVLLGILSLTGFLVTLLYVTVLPFPF